MPRGPRISSGTADYTGIHVYLPRDEHQYLLKYAAKLGISPSLAIRKLIKRALPGEY